MVAPASATASATLAGDPLEGIWRTAPISPADAEATLRQHDLEQYIQQFGDVTPVSEEMVLILDIHDGEWDLYGMPNGGARQEIDYDADYTVDGDEVAVAYFAGTNTFRWSINGDMLTLEWVATTLPDYQNIPEEVFQRVLYMMETFERQA